MRLALVTCISFLFSWGSSLAQQSQNSSSSRTVEVWASDSAETDADLAAISLGYKNYASTKDAAYEANLRASKSILEAIQAAGVPREQIHTTDVTLKRTYDENDTDLPKAKRDSAYEAYQSWTIRVPAGDAQKVVDIAVGSGANEVQAVEWEVRTPADLEAKAYSAAVSKARAIAEQLAKNAGAKLGDLISVSNSSSNANNLPLLADVAFITKSGGGERPNLKLFPKKVKREVSVRVVFTLS